MPLITPHIPTDREQYEFESWARSECHRFYVEVRRSACNSRQLLDLWVRAPHCESCACSDAFHRTRMTEISPGTWEQDVALSLGNDLLRAIRRALRDDPDHALSCMACGESLRPWSRDDVWIIIYHLEEHYGIPIEVRGQRAARSLRRNIFTLYGNRCFGCGSHRGLHLDHVLPRSKGGTAAFRNLQALCEACGQAKGDNLPEEVEVFSDVYFGAPASDAHEGLFW